MESRQKNFQTNPLTSQSELIPETPAAAKRAGAQKRSISDLLGGEWCDQTIWRRAVWDHRIDGEAFRLWHYLRDRIGPGGYVIEYFAAMRVMEVALRCKHG